jgi:hypothetical protein
VLLWDKWIAFFGLNAPVGHYKWFARLVMSSLSLRLPTLLGSFVTPGMVGAMVILHPMSEPGEPTSSSLG